MGIVMDRRWLVALMVAVASVAAGIWFGRGVNVPAPGDHVVLAPPSTSTTRPTTGIVVHVAGWVESPGLVQLDEGARVGDALAAAGGVRPGASLAAVNLAQSLGDGEQIFVPGPAGSVGGAEQGPTADDGDGLVHLNTADVTALEQLPGVGPVLAERILAHREEMGPFRSVEDLLEVSGIGEAKLASIRDLVVVP